MNHPESNVNTKYKYSDITGKIIGCAIKVHNELGCGFQEVIYQRCLAIEMEATGLHFRREAEIPIHYKGQDVGTRRADFIVEDRVLVELKAISALDNAHFAQIINYLEAFKLEIGLLINFGGEQVIIKRFINDIK
ncbi:MAG: GxxExxY protein [bacterium]|nr:GxxExxY protein [bacterium]